jgi:Flp pilus assembly protein TadD
MGVSSRPLIGLTFSALLLAGCQMLSPSDKVAPPVQAADPKLEQTLRKAAADAEANYKYGEAAQHYAKLLEKHPDDQDVVLAVARNLRYSGSPQQATVVINQHVTKGSVSEPLLMELGKDYLASDQLSLAVSVLEQARSADPTNWQILSSLAVAEDYLGNFKEAQAHYQDALKLSANNPVVLNNYALSLAQSGQLDAAIETLNTATAQPGVTAQTRQNLALMLALKGDKEGAARLVKADLPPDMAQNNINYYQGLGAQ